MRMIAPEDSSAPPSAAQLLSSERCRFFDQSRNRPDQLCECASDGGGICHDEGGGAAIPSRAVTRRSAVQKMTVAAIDSLVRGEPEASSPPRPESTRSQAILCAVCDVFADCFILGEAIRAPYSLRRRQRGQRLHAQDAA